MAEGWGGRRTGTGMTSLLMIVRRVKIAIRLGATAATMMMMMMIT